MAETAGRHPLLELFAPDRVAVVGATPSEGAVGRAVVDNLRDGFTGDVVAVNPKYDEVLGVPCYGALGDLPDPPDLVVVAVPPDAVVGVVEEAAAIGVRDVVVITAGFAESGSAGARRQRALVDVAERHDLHLVGPNSLGVIGTASGLNATFAPVEAPEGGVSFLSQSGAFVTAALDWASDAGVGFRDVVSLGNKAVLDEADFVEAWGDDPGTDVIAGYLEGVADGPRFVEACRSVTRDTPVVIVKSGRTEAGARAVSSHTGTLAGSERAYEAGLDAAGAIRADSAEQLFDYARVLADQPLPGEGGVAVVTNAGGPGVMATDAVGDAPLDLASLAPATRDALEDALPDAASTLNPVDVIGDADAERYRDALDVVADDPDVAAVVAVACPTATLSFDALAEALVAAHRDAPGVPLVACLMGGERIRSAAATLRDAGVPNYFDPHRAVDALGALHRQRAVEQREHAEPRAIDVDEDRADRVLNAVAARDDNRVGVEAMELLEAYGIPTPASELVDSADAAVEAADAIGPPVAMKLVSPDVLHKTDIGGVAVDVARDDVGDTYEDLVSRARNYQPDARILGVQVQEMVDVDAGVECIAGANRDPQFGPLVLFGLGGVFVEVFEDTALRLAPVARQEAASMLDEIRAAPLLRGARGRDAVDEDAVVDAVERIGRLVADVPAIQELDVNPLVATPDGAVAVDFRMTVDVDALADRHADDAAGVGGDDGTASADGPTDQGGDP